MNQFPAHDSRVDALFGDVLEIVEEQCRQALSAGNEEFVDECLYVLDKLGPDAATGRHDLFWAKIRELQPGALSFRNPTYKTASLAEHVTEDPAYWPAPGLDDTDLSYSGLPLELHGA